MTSFIEAQRLSLENIHAIEDAITKRVLRNPELIPEDLQSKHGGNILPQKSNSSYTENLKLLQQHELNFFLEEHLRLLKSIFHCFEDEKYMYEQEVQLLKDDTNFSKFDKMAENILDGENQDEVAANMKNLYSSFNTNNPSNIRFKINKKTNKEKRLVKRKFILSSAASHLNETNFDEVLELKPFFDIYNANFTSKKKSYMEFLYNFQNFPYEITNHLYDDYLKDLYNYLWSRYNLLNPLKNSDKISKEVNAMSSKDSAIGLTNTNQVSNLYCKACFKLFTNQSVYDGHLNGKKHKKNAAKVGDDTSNGNSNLWYENAIRVLAKNLEQEINHTEKMTVLSEREKFIEDQNKNDMENEFTSAELSSSDEDNSEENDSDSDSELFKNLPLGPDGSPIPYWLYKLQGLHRKYTCEICGNVSYQGKQTFEKHFNGQKHIHGLKCLAVEEEDFPYFKNITSIDEAQKLIQVLRKQNKFEQNEVQDAIEVEDKQGNVMSYVDYVDLKRQGLI
ncbi:sap61 [Candida jiufengensis]|uniref:sap61 n=1 Tax=Candida jiufengensis TaxID=497108 RepID=UPI002224892E|nr:sap61 [Candida jiufengensis]KAI5956554.1 sap61 [Candida jiufengensis]